MEKKSAEDWLSDVDFRSKQQEILKSRQPGTGIWVLESDEFLVWVNGDGPPGFWCPGIPGAGKTLLSAIITDHLSRLKNSADTSIACLFCEHNERERQNAESFLANLVKQCLQDSFGNKAQAEIVEFQTRNQKPNWNQLCEIFKGQISKFTRAFVVIDALDESPGYGSIRQQLLPFLMSLPVRLLITSRYDLAIERNFKSAQSFDLEANDMDIRSYVSGPILLEPPLARLISRDPELQGEKIMMNLAHLDFPLLAIWACIM